MTYRIRINKRIGTLIVRKDQRGRISIKYPNLEAALQINLYFKYIKDIIDKERACTTQEVYNQLKIWDFSNNYRYPVISASKVNISDDPTLLVLKDLNLSPIEIEIAKLHYAGFMQKQIRESLQISQKEYRESYNHIHKVLSTSLPVSEMYY